MKLVVTGARGVLSQAPVEETDTHAPQDVSRERAGRAPFIRWLLVGALVAWSGSGLAVTTGALTNPDLWHARGATPVVGTPLAGAAETAVIRALLDSAPAVAGERWLVVFPSGSDPLVLLYIGYQLAHVQYPRRVDVVTAEAAPVSGNYSGVIAAPGVRVSDAWQPDAQHGGFTRHIARRS